MRQISGLHGVFHLRYRGLVPHWVPQSVPQSSLARQAHFRSATADSSSTLAGGGSGLQSGYLAFHRDEKWQELITVQLDKASGDGVGLQDLGRREPLASAIRFRIL